MADPTTFTLPAGTVCKRNGIPFTLMHATQIECHPGVWLLIKGDPPDEVEMPAEVPVNPLRPSQGASVDAEGDAAIRITQSLLQVNPAVPDWRLP